jgi:DNA topoisomerase I
LPRDKAPETVTLEEALVLLAARAEQIANGSGRARPGRKTAKSSAKSAPPPRPAGGKMAKPVVAKPSKAGVAKSAKPPAKSTRPRKAAEKSAKKPVTKPAAPKVRAKRAKGAG